MTVLSTHTVYRGLLWSVGLLALTMVVRARLLRLDLPVRHAPPLLRAGSCRASRAAARRASRPTRRTPTSARSTTCSTPSSSPASRAAPSAASSIPICIAVRSIGLGVIPAVQYLVAPRRSARAQDVHSRAVQGAADHAQDFLAQTVWQTQAVLLPPDLVHRLPARRGPLREPLHPALLVPRALPARRVPRRLLALRALRDDEGPREVHRLQPVPRPLPGRRLARRAASSGGRTSATCA